MRVTFDSNVWRQTVSPAKFPGDPDRSAFAAIREAIIAGKVEPFLSDTTLTLEAIKKKQRLAFFAQYTGHVAVQEGACEKGPLGFSFSIGPDPNSHAVTHPIPAGHLADAISMGFKLLRATRVAGVQNHGLRDEDYADSEDTIDRATRFGDCARALETEGYGLRHLKTIGSANAGGGFWLDGLGCVPPQDESAVIKAVAEWADGDSIALHYAYNNDYFCTRDQGKSKSPPSVFSSKGRAWALREFGIRCVSPVELVKIVTI